jgi:hypothetical protein
VSRAVSCTCRMPMPTQSLTAPLCVSSPRDVVGKIKDTATTAIETLTGSKPQDKAAGRLTREQQQQQRGRAPLYRPDGECG